MRILHRVLVGGLMLASAAIAQGAEPATSTAVLSIPSMTCPACPLTVRKALQRVEGVQAIAVDLEAKTVTVTFDPRRTGTEALQAATGNAGYPAQLRP